MNCKYPTGIACYLFTVSDYNVFKCLEILMFVTFVDALNQCRRRLPQCQSMHSFHLAWAIAIRCYKASPMDYCRNFSQFKMRQHVLSQEHGGVTTSHQCYMIYTLAACSTKNCVPITSHYITPVTPFCFL